MGEHSGDASVPAPLFPARSEVSGLAEGEIDIDLDFDSDLDIDFVEVAPTDWTEAGYA
jgi:hypothetical protein